MTAVSAQQQATASKNTKKECYNEISFKIRPGVQKRGSWKIKQKKRVVVASLQIVYNQKKRKSLLKYLFHL